ncbi:conserved hypothetical protein [Culex quinquefasciatus]|uniref:Uncharacterized protein n=1 Tax=Culex quinquefasciatus TaxID=7176 RepID=B0WRA2_CULQU|nr:conserved hypothetical protein [Culex quinquefasciatus]|eukprot:XP_001851236.1 conserved hypothetical protein [Culex quinquefasciatus]
MSSDNSKPVSFDQYHFWLQIEKLVGPVPENIKLLLQFSCFCNSSIADLDDELIDQIEQEARTIPTVLRITANERLMKRFFGVYFLIPNEFRFRSGERRMMKNIALAVRRKGLDSFIQSLRTIQHHTEPRPAVSVQLQNCDPQSLRQILRDKLLNAIGRNLQDVLKSSGQHGDPDADEQGIRTRSVFCPLWRANQGFGRTRNGKHTCVSNYTLARGAISRTWDRLSHG